MAKCDPQALFFAALLFLSAACSTAATLGFPAAALFLNGGRPTCTYIHTHGVTQSLFLSSAASGVLVGWGEHHLLLCVCVCRKIGEYLPA